MTPRELALEDLQRLFPTHMSMRDYFMGQMCTTTAFGLNIHEDGELLNKQEVRAIIRALWDIADIILEERGQ